MKSRTCCSIDYEFTGQAFAPHQDLVAVCVSFTDAGVPTIEKILVLALGTFRQSLIRDFEQVARCSACGREDAGRQAEKHLKAMITAPEFGSALHDVDFVIEQWCDSDCIGIQLAEAPVDDALVQDAWKRIQARKAHAAKVAS